MESRYESLWLDTSQKTSYPDLTKDIETDIAVVGGGIAGLMTAYMLAKHGEKVTVVEANQIVTGTTAYTTAKATILHDAKYHFLIKHFSREKAKIYAQSNQWAIEELERIVSDEQIDCNFKRVNAFLYTNEQKKFKEIEDELTALNEIGFRADAENNIHHLPFPISHSLSVPNQALFHPRKFLLTIAQKIVDSGGQIFENTRVTEINNGYPCQVVSPKATITANKVVIATNYPIMDKDFFFLRVDQMRSYAFAIQTRDLVSDDMFIGIGEHEITVRTYQERDKKWVIIGGEAHPTGETQATDKKYQRLEEIVRNSFTVDTIDFKWSAQDASTLDRVPLTGKMPHTENIFVTTGYGEWGMTTSIMSAKLLTDLIKGRINEWAELYDPSRINLTAATGKAVEMGKQIAKGFGSYLSGQNEDQINTLKPGEGMVVNKSGKKVAVSKNDEGQLQEVSAVCTHMGCIVEWNKAEGSWDCPCHGSRFTTSGEVIHGPATKPLEKLKEE